MQSDGKASVTYAELNRQSNQTAHWLFNFGLRVRDGVAILLDNDLRFFIIAWAAQLSGLYYTPISTLFQAQEIRYIIDNSDARVLFTKQSILERTQVELPKGLKVITLDEGPHTEWSSAIADHSGEDRPDACEGAEMIYSSGTTGQPKGVRFDLALSPP